MSQVLVLTTEASGVPPPSALATDASDSVTWFDADPEAPEPPLPTSWRRVRTSDLLDNDRLCDDFQRFIAEWPGRVDRRGRSFDDLFRFKGGYSLWWTSIGLDRNTEKPLFRSLRKVWLFDQALRCVSPDRVFLYTRDSAMAWAIESRCRAANVTLAYLPGSARAVDPWSGRIKWLIGSLVWLAVTPWLMGLRAVLARCVAPRASESAKDRGRPVVLLTGVYPRDLVEKRRPMSYLFWKNVPEALQRAMPDLRLKYLLQMSSGRYHGYRPITPYFHTGWRWLAGDPQIAPLSERHACWGAYLAAVAPQLRALLNYRRFERDPLVRNSFDFAGADVAGLYVPRLRKVVARMAGWVRQVAAIEKAIRDAGDVRAILIDDEFYERGAMIIAAARRRKVPTIASQHGTIYPMHLVYRLPREQVVGGPMPDYFAAYGPYARHIVSERGAFPIERVWLSGGARFDHLVSAATDASAARARLGLPLDRRIILITTQHYPWFLRAAEAVFRAAREQPDWFVCLKTHPIDVSVDVYRAVAEKVGLQAAAFFESHFDELLTACDVLVSASSTTVLEAILAGKRTVCVNFSDEEDWFPYTEDGGSLPGSSDDEVRASLIRCFDPAAQDELAAARRRFIERHIPMAADGRAAATLAAQVAGVCRLAEGGR